MINLLTVATNIKKGDIVFMNELKSEDQVENKDQIESEEEAKCKYQTQCDAKYGRDTKNKCKKNCGIRLAFQIGLLDQKIDWSRVDSRLEKN